MRKSLAILLVAACGGGASDTKTDQTKPVAPAEQPMEPVAEPAPPPPPPPPKPKLTSDDFAKADNALNDAISAHDPDKIGALMAANAQGQVVDMGAPPAVGGPAVVAQVYKPFLDAFPDLKLEPVLTLVNGNHAVALVVAHGTNGGPFMGMPASNKKFGLYAARINDFDEDGKATRDDHLVDGATMMMQLNPPKGAKSPPALEKAPYAPVTAVASGNETEKANLEVAKKFMDAFNKHDTKGALALAAPDLATHGGAMDDKGPKHFTDMFKSHTAAFPDTKFDVKSQWAAGDYVVSEFDMSGTNTGAMPQMGIKKATKKPVNVHGVQIVRIDGGKVKDMYMLVNGGAIMAQLGLIPPGPPPAKK